MITKNWADDDFKIAINMAGAVSAGAYTAGVLDFLMQALEEWEKAKTAFRTHLANPAPGAPFANPVPLHKVTIEAFSGASAGGMCAAIASAMVPRPFVHITDAKATGTNNTFYEAWVNRIDISGLLDVKDLKANGPLVSLLDSTIIDEIAQYALTFSGPPTPPPYVSESLNLFLTLTNVRGVPYQLYSDPSPSQDEFITYYADRLRFETVPTGTTTSTPVAKPLPLDSPGSIGWHLLQDAAKATGAFPLFLASRPLNRDLIDFDVPMWIPVSGPSPAPPIPSDLPGAPMKSIQTLNVDGGVTDNDPFDLAHDFLASHNPKAVASTPPTNPRGPLEANCAVISVAPFPSQDRYDKDFDIPKNQGLFQMLARLVTVLISQSRFLGESLALLTTGATFSRFVIAPSGDSKTTGVTSPGSPLQCARLGAFGGFTQRSFRAHDFLLGRRNCQKFLMSYFRLPASNPVIASGLKEAGSYAASIEATFTDVPPAGVTVPPAGKVWMPIIPLVGTAFETVQAPERGTITSGEISKIADAVIARFDAIKGPLLSGAPAAWLLKTLIGIVCTWPTRLLVRRKIVDALSQALAPDVRST